MPHQQHARQVSRQSTQTQATTNHLSMHNPKSSSCSTCVLPWHNVLIKPHQCLQFLCCQRALRLAWAGKEA